MADGTTIEWTDATWNPITGCSVMSPGCTNCYAMRLAGTRLQHDPSRAGLARATKAGPVWTGEVRFNEQWLDQPLRWRRPRRIFVCAHGDLFHEAVPDVWIDRVLAVMALAPQHSFQVLTKRPERMRDYLAHIQAEFDASPDDLNERFGAHCAQLSGDPCAAGWFEDHVNWPLPNVWLGVSVEDQLRADERIPILLDTPAAVRWVSAEPLLGPVDLYGGDPDPRLGGVIAGEGLSLVQWWRHDDPRGAPLRPGVDWVVAGGESGPGARPMHPDWARSLRDQCAAAGVPFLFKQWGEWAELRGPHGIPRGHCEPGGAYFAWDDGVVSERVGKKAAGRLLDGELHDAWPEARA